MLRTLPGSGLVMRLSLVAGACVCITVKCSNDEFLDLEPLDVKKLQSKNLNDYLKDIILSEKVDFVLDSDKQWVHVAEVLKRCQKFSGDHQDPSQEIKTREIFSNALHPGPVEKQHSITFTPMRVAVVTCKTNATDNNNEPDDEFATENPGTKEDSNQDLNNQQSIDNEEINFEQEISNLLHRYGKTPRDLNINPNLLNQNSIQHQQKHQSSSTTSFLLCQQMPLGNEHPQQSQKIEKSGKTGIIRSVPSSSTLSSHLEEDNTSTKSSKAKQISPISTNTNKPIEQSERFYFANNHSSGGSLMPTMNRPIVLMPAIATNANPSYMITPTISSINSRNQESIMSSTMDSSSLYSSSNTNSSNTICTSSCCSSTLSTTISGDNNESSPINSILYQQMSVQKQTSTPIIMQQQINEGNVFQNLNYNQQHLNPSAEQRHQQQLLQQQQQFHFRMS
uniref:SH3 domain-containing protein n=1 Tax=Meloidogyne hapla TaxID=6305 RepID=A0A1I8B1F4_MELHA